MLEFFNVKEVQFLNVDRRTMTGVVVIKYSDIRSEKWFLRDFEGNWVVYGSGKETSESLANDLEFSFITYIDEAFAPEYLK